MSFVYFVLQESYAMLNRYELLVAKDESERVDTLRYSWQKLQALAVYIIVSCGSF